MTQLSVRSLSSVLKLPAALIQEAGEDPETYEFQAKATEGTSQEEETPIDLLSQLNAIISTINKMESQLLATEQSQPPRPQE